MSRRRLPVQALAAATLVLAGGGAACSSGGSAGRAAAPVSSTTTSSAAPTATTAAAVSARPSAGCGRRPDVARLSAGRPGDVEQTFTSGGLERLYRLAIPTSYDPDVAAPLVVNLHGSGSNALEASAYGDVPRAAATRGMITVAPQAIGGRWELGGSGSDDDFLMALVDSIEARYCIDQARVHLVGMSLGAWKAAVTACAHPGRFASISLVTVEVFPGTCEPMPVLAFHGTADPVVAYGAGGGTVDQGDTPNAGVPGSLGNIARWARNGGCAPRPVITEIGDDVVRRRFRRCDAGVGVEHYTVIGGGHTWPGSDIDITDPALTSHTIDATALTLDWFQAHPARP